MNLTSTQKAPSPNLITPHFVLGGFSLVVVAFILMLYPSAVQQHYFNPVLLASTHLLVLGFITLICFGALYQLLPVILDVKLYSEKIGITTLFTLVVGVFFLVISFWNLNLKEVFYVAGTLISIAILLFTTNVFLTIKQDSNPSIEKLFVIAATVWLFITVILGFLFGLNLSFNFFDISHLELLKLHAHIGIFGWFIQLIIGIGSKLFPMFLLSYEASKKPLNIAFYTLNVGLLLGFLSLFSTSKSSIKIAVFLVLIAIGSFLYFIFETYTKRVKKSIDYGMKKAVLAVVILLIPFLIIISLFYFQSTEFSVTQSFLYGFALLIGFITMLVMGLTYKTLPFIIWLKLYKDYVGKHKIPMPKDLYSESTQKLQLLLFIGSLITIPIGILFSFKLIIRVGTIMLFASTIFYFLNILKIVLHKRCLS